jgi:hypothetical protein
MIKFDAVCRYKIQRLAIWHHSLFIGNQGTVYSWSHLDGDHAIRSGWCQEFVPYSMHAQPQLHHEPVLILNRRRFICDEGSITDGICVLLITVGIDFMRVKVLSGETLGCIFASTARID